MAKRSSRDLVQGEFKPAPLVDIKKVPEGKKQVTFKGKLVEARKVAKTKFGDKPVYGFAAIDGDALFMLKGVEVEVAEGDTVSLWPSEGIDKKLQALNIAVGEIVTFVSQGLKVNAKTGRKFYDVEISVE